jgi:hypothetical protein
MLANKLTCEINENGTPNVNGILPPALSPLTFPKFIPNPEIEEIETVAIPEESPATDALTKGGRPNNEISPLPVPPRTVQVSMTAKEAEEKAVCPKYCGPEKSASTDALVPETEASAKTVFGGAARQERDEFRLDTL